MSKYILLIDPTSVGNVHETFILKVLSNEMQKNSSYHFFLVCDFSSYMNTIRLVRRYTSLDIAKISHIPINTESIFYSIKFVFRLRTIMKIVGSKLEKIIFLDTTSSTLIFNLFYKTDKSQIIKSYLHGSLRLLSKDRSSRPQTRFEIGRKTFRVHLKRIFLWFPWFLRLNLIFKKNVKFVVLGSHIKKSLLFFHLFPLRNVGVEVLPTFSFILEEKIPNKNARNFIILGDFSISMLNYLLPWFIGNNSKVKLYITSPKAKYIFEKSVSDNVIHVSDINREHLCELANTLDYIIMLRLKDNLSLQSSAVFFESLALNLPIIAPSWAWERIGPDFKPNGYFFEDENSLLKIISGLVSTSDDLTSFIPKSNYQ